jgi:hypothetical protein
MFARFFASQDTSRFEKCQALADVKLVLAQLRKKEIQLKEDAKKNGITSVDFKKQIVVTMLLQNLDDEIEKFNALPVPLSEEQDYREIHQLIKNLLVPIQQVLKNDDHILKLPRNLAKPGAVAALETTALGVTLGTATAGSFTVVGTLAAIWLNKHITNLLKSMTGLTDLTPESARIIIDLTTLLINAEENLSKHFEKIMVPIKRKETKEQRTAGILALNTHLLFRQLPDELKEHILWYVRSGSEKETNEEKIKKHNINLIKVANSVSQVRDERLKLK